MIAKKINTAEKIRYQMAAIKHEITQEERSLGGKRARLVMMARELAKLEMMERAK